MNSEIINFFISQGAFAVLFGYLLLYVLRENSSREARYQELLKDMTDLLPELKKDVSDIKKFLEK